MHLPAQKQKLNKSKNFNCNFPQTDIQHFGQLKQIREILKSQRTSKGNSNIQAKLKAGEPGDKYEKEADTISQSLEQKPTAEKLTETESNTNQNTSISKKTNKLINNSSGNQLPGGIRDFMEPQMKCNLENVRIHTNNESAELNTAMSSRALTHGNDIYFGKGEFNPASENGRQLIAHELVHVMQQNGAQPTGMRLSSAPDNLVSGAWTSLGNFTWNHFILHDRLVVLNVMTGNSSDWKARLKNLDDDNELWQVAGFMETSADPSLATRKRPKNQARALNYQNNVTRAPNQNEILEFLDALYNLGSKLDLPDHNFEASGIPRRAFRSNLNTIINKYQGLLMQKTSESGKTMSSAGISAIVDETDRSSVMPMIQNAAATAMKAVDIIATAKSSGNSDDLSNALALIGNAGRTIRYTLNAHNTDVAFNNSIAQGVFDVVWSIVPGGGTLATAGKEILKIGFKKMLDDASKDDEPAKQAQKILDKFIEHVRKARKDGHLGTGEIGVLVERAAITGFEAAMR